MIIESSRWQRPLLNEGQQVKQRVAKILADIQQQGERAIDDYSQQYDGFKPEWIELKPFEEYDLDDELRAAIQLAANRIKRFAEFQMESIQSRSFSDEFGEYSQIVAPIERIAAYIPGGKAPLISTALMTLIPAAVAGCHSRIALSPSINTALLAAASLAGATRFLRIGGTQAIAAAAWGYREMLANDMVVGPGNAYVAEAKSQLQHLVKIDTVAGPSEVLIVADDDTPLDWIIEDAYAQSEHGDDACAIVVSCSESTLLALEKQLEAKPDGLRLLQRQQIQLIKTDNRDDLIAFCNRYAPEHLQWSTDRFSSDGLRHYGALFIGAQSPVALGDYLCGPNHTLPTAGSARRTAGLSVAEFVRLQTRQTLTRPAPLYHQAAKLADAEGLAHHARSLRIRST